MSDEPIESIEPIQSPRPTSRAKIIADSIGPNGVRLTTFECEYPRYIHAEVATHRMLSRNGRSSRAEPVARAIRRAIDDPVEPLVWMYDAKQMRHGQLMTDDDAYEAKILWEYARNRALDAAWGLEKIGLHRQYLTRIIEPYLRIKMVISATSFANFFALRLHPSPMPEIQQLAAGMARALKSSEPKRLVAGQWHLPYIMDEEHIAQADILIPISVARCARVSYDSPRAWLEWLDEVRANIALHDRLLAADPKHASPAEHVAQATDDPTVRSGNFTGWIQYRHTIRGESHSDLTFDLDARLTEYEGVDYIL